MDKNTISLIGIVDTLKYLLETDKKARKSADAAAACKRLENMRQKLLAEGLRQSQILGAARDSIFEIATQLDVHLAAASTSRNLQWVIHGLISADIQEVEPPPLQSSSSSSAGPKSASPEIVQLAEAIATLVATRSKGATPEIAPMTARKREVKPPQSPANGKAAKG